MDPRLVGLPLDMDSTHPLMTGDVSGAVSLVTEPETALPQDLEEARQREGGVTLIRGTRDRKLGLPSK